MRRTPYLAILFAITLGFSMLTSCGDLNSSSLPESTASVSAPVQLSISPELRSALTDLQNAQKKFDESLGTYLDGLSEIAQTSETSPDQAQQDQRKALLDGFKSEAPNEKLQKVTEAANSVGPQLSKLSNPTSRTQAENSLSQINKTAQELQQKVLGLLNVRDPATIGQVQDQFGLTASSLGKSHGHYNSQTHEKISKFLGEQQKILDAEVQALTTPLTSASPSPTSSPSPGGEPGVAQIDWVEWSVFSGLGVVALGSLLLLLRASLTRRSSKSNSLSRGSSLGHRVYQLEDQVYELERQVCQLKAINRNQETQINALQTDNQRLEGQIWQIQNNKTQSLEHSNYSQQSSRPSPLPTNTLLGWQTDQSSRMSPPLTLTSPSLAYRQTPEQLLIELYNRNPSELKKTYSAKTVSIPIEAQGSLWVGKTEAAVLQEDQQGNYWVIEDGDNSYLVPKGGIRLNSSSLEPLAVLYDFENQADVDRPLKLTKVAVVSRLSGSVGWQLAEKGSLRFGEYRS